MPSIDGFELPRGIVETLQRHVDRADEGALRALAGHFPDLKKGFRSMKAGGAFIRQRLRSHVSAAGALDEGLRRFLAGQSLNQSFIAVLATEVLVLFLEQFQDIFGRMDFLAGMLLDEREEVRQAAIDELKAGRHRKGADTATARWELRDGLAPFLGHLVEQGLSGASGKPETESAERQAAGPREEKHDRGPTRDLAESVRAAGKEQRRLKLHAEHLEKRLKDAEEQARKFRQQVEQDRKRREELVAERDQAREQGSAALARLEGEVDTRVQTALAARFRTWLTEAEATEAMAGKGGKATNDLLERAAAALARQRDVDRKSGNLRLLRERREQVEAMIADFRLAAAEALSPLPELRKLERELVAERERLGKALGDANGSSPLSRVLLARIGAASGPEDLLRIQQLLGELDAQDALDPREMQRLHAACNAALGKIYDKNIATGRPRRPTTEPLLRLQDAVAQGLAFALLVDGHNVLFGLPHIYGPLYDGNGLPGARARDALLSSVATLIGETGRGRAWVFFDGETQDERPYSFTVREVYSGGGKASVRDRADQAILDYLDRVVRKDGLTVLVTDDVELGRAARGRSAQVTSLAAFSSLLLGLSAQRRGRNT